MIVNKVTIGYVVQKFDTETGYCIEQVFIAGDEVSYEDKNGESVDWEEENYQPFDMVQPEKSVAKGTKRCCKFKDNSPLSDEEKKLFTTDE